MIPAHTGAAGMYYWQHLKQREFSFFFFFLIACLLVIYLLRPHPWHVEIPRLGIEPMLLQKQC